MFRVSGAEFWVQGVWGGRRTAEKLPLVIVLFTFSSGRYLVPKVSTQPLLEVPGISHIGTWCLWVLAKRCWLLAFEVL